MPNTPCALPRAGRPVCDDQVTVATGNGRMHRPWSAIGWSYQNNSHL